MSLSDVSILLPVYNGATYLAEQLQSVLDQSFGDFELLIIDDASTDGSWQIIQDFAGRDRRILPRRQTKNSGQLAALAELFKTSESDWIMVCDQDDVWERNKIERLRSAAGDLSLVYGPSRLIAANGADLGRTTFDAIGPPFQGHDRIEALFGTTVSGHALMARRNVVTLEAFMPSRVMYDQRLAAAATFMSSVGYCPDAVTLHRIHETNQNNASLKDGGRASRSAPVDRLGWLCDMLDYLRGHAAIGFAKRKAFSELHRIVVAHHKRLGGWFVQSRDFSDGFMRAAEQITRDAEGLKFTQRKISRLARGTLHPRYWLSVLRAD